MGRMVVARRANAEGKLRNSEPLCGRVSDGRGIEIVPTANACSWEDFLFHLGPVTPRTRLHQADRDLRAHSTATLDIDDNVVDEPWIKSFLLTED